MTLFKKFPKKFSYFLFSFFIISLLVYIYYVFNLPAEKGAGIINAYIYSFSVFIIVSVIIAFLSTKINLSPSTKKLILMLFKASLFLYAIYLFMRVLSRYLTFSSPASDIPYFHYAILQLSRFQLPVIWDIPSRYVWGDHFSPILILLSPFYWIAPTGTTLMAIQALFVLLATIPIYKVSKYTLKSVFLSLCLSFSYLIFGGLQAAYDYGFHEIVLLPPFFFSMYYFYKKTKKRLYFLFLFLSLSVKEEVSLIIIAWGIYCLIFHKDKKIPLATFFSGILWYLMVFYIIFPYFNQGVGFGHWGQYQVSSGADGIISIILNGIFHPLEFLTTLVTPAYKIKTIFQIFSPFLFLPIFYPPSIIILLPSILEKLLSNNLAGYNIFHYSVAITVTLMVAIIETLQSILDNKFWRKIVSHQKIFWGTAIFFSSLFSSMMYGYYQLSPFLISYEINKAQLSDIELRTQNYAISLIPKEASVSAHAILTAHLNKPMDKLKHGPNLNDTSDFILTNSRLPDYFLNGTNPGEVLNTLVKSGKYKVLINENSAVLLKRTDVKP